ncbi:MAG: hypothetical protein EBR49_01685 [Betaproteobacteria bacterium]|nr:hypothetical protein [Betaproteobacteria bacterium]
MGIFSIFSGAPKKFVTQASFEKNLSGQLAMSPQTVAQLRNLNVTPEKELKLEFFFYTNTPEKAAALAAGLTSKKYEVEYGPSASNGKIQIITGWTEKIGMSDANVAGWTKEMCELGFKHDCEFDGWGTNPEQ